MSSWKSGILHFDGLLLFKSCTVSAKKCQKSYLSWHWRVWQSLKKNWHVVSNMTKGIWWLPSNHSKVWKLLFVQSIKVWAKKKKKEKYRGVIFYDTEQWCKIWIILDLVVSKLAWGIWWTFTKSHKNLKICTLMGSFCQKRNNSDRKFQKNLCHNTERWCKI